MAETYETLEEATRALTSTAQRAATLLRQESERARHEAGRAREEAQRAWGEIESVRGDIVSAKAEIDEVRSSMSGSHNESQRLRINAKMAWGTVGVMGILVIIAVGWTASVLTRSNVQVGHLNEKIDEVSTLSDARATEIGRLRSEMESARIARAQAEGELRAVSYARTLLSDASFGPLDLQFNSAPAKSSGFADLIGRLIEDIRWGEPGERNAVIPVIPAPGDSKVQVTELPTKD